MTCTDCPTSPTLVYDLNQQGLVCPRCERVWNPNLPSGHLHYASQMAVKKRMEKDRRRMSITTDALAQRIIRGD